MAATQSNRKNKIFLLLFATIVVGLALYFYASYFEFTLPTGQHRNWQKLPILVLASLLGYLATRFLNAALFDFAFRLRKRYEAPTLVRNIFTLLAFAILFVLLFKGVYNDYDLGALFTTSALFGVIIGLALQDTLGNFFSGISLHADRPFQVGDVIALGPQKITGVVEGITWRAIKLRTFGNNIALVSNSVAAKEAIEVFPRDNPNARLVYFSTLYTDSPAKTIHIVREAVREAENVSPKLTPIVRIRGLGESAVEWE